MVIEKAAGNVRAGPWFQATTFGWLLGFALLVVLAIGWQALTGEESQWMVGAGMGVGIGYVQSRLLRGVLDRPGRWIWATATGFTIPFILWDLSAAAGASFLSLPICVVTGGLLVGLLQWSLLRSRSSRAGWWIPVSVLGWAVPAAALGLSSPGELPSVWRELLSFGGMFLGGAALGAVTGAPLAWMLRNPALQSPPA